MRKQGTVVRWEAARGFGFIRVPSMQDIFFHVQDFRSQGGATPQVGMLVDFDEIHVGGKGPRAMVVRPVGAAPAQKTHAGQVRQPRRNISSGSASTAWAAIPLMVAYTGILLYAVLTNRAPWWILAASAGLNLVTFFDYWRDKYAAEKGRWRIKESSLHFWSFIGGWGGAWFGQQILRHKSRKASFQQVYWLSVIVHCAAVGYLVLQAPVNGWSSR
jgi:uncharacterized membrane protein YsdA (DUF1294 family)/cold shock CspA family protein